MGITQNVDAAASTLYLGYRNFDAEIRCTGATMLQECARALRSLPARRARACRPSRSTPSSAARS